MEQTGEQMKNMAQGATDAVKNTLGMNEKPADSAGGNTAGNPSNPANSSGAPTAPTTQQL